MPTLDIAVPVLRSVDDALAAAADVAATIAVGDVQRELDGILPTEALIRVAESGLLSIITPAAFGGPDLPRSTAVEVLRILSRADAAVGQLLLPHFVVGAAIRGLGDAAPAPEIYADVLAGAQLGNATVELGTRTSVERRTTVRRRPDGSWTLTGTKYYATGSLGATWIAVAARIDETDHGATVFVRPTDPGVRLALEKWSSFGQRGTASGEVVLDEVQVPDTHVIDEGPDPDPVTAGPSVLGAFDQALHTAVDVGIARAALEDGAEFAATRSRPWFEAGVERAADEPHVVRRFGELTARLYALEALLAHGASLVDAALLEPEPRVGGEGLASSRRSQGPRTGVRRRDRQRRLRTRGHLRHRGRVRPGPSLAEPAGAHAARPGPVEVRPPRTSHPRRHTSPAPGPAAVSD